MKISATLPAGRYVVSCLGDCGEVGDTFVEAFSFPAEPVVEFEHNGQPAVAVRIGANRAGNGLRTIGLGANGLLLAPIESNDDGILVFLPAEADQESEQSYASPHVDGLTVIEQAEDFIVSFSDHTLTVGNVSFDAGGNGSFAVNDNVVDMDDPAMIAKYSFNEAEMDEHGFVDPVDEDFVTLYYSAPLAA
ncbi:hypothetical protein [Croceicoccus gelatinilyticus]|uniref:hypothetical protein n=1 Tax=Croceicoccus gelatinilyticus TaxID=2835536 RepID=UPI001BD181A8|nr:hypothetical protein [Croceicoccus gelatinilyticus]MBS7671517.1 hypothetical protein [Croceicoccus gelatinilyticus]